MSEKYLLSIKGLQSGVGENDETDVTLTTEADFEKQDGVFFINYEESEVTGLEGTKTSIEIGKDYVSLQRQGNVNTNMLFMKGKKTHSFYNTPYGDLLIGIYTEKINIDVSEKGGTANAEYLIDINNANTGKNNFYIEIKEA